jgi:translation initiation factor IF-2
LLEAILLVADATEIKANPKGRVFGSVIEARLDRNKGVVATLLVQNGTLRVGEILIAGSASGNVRAMFDYQGKPVTEATPSTPVSVLGLSDVPDAGEVFITVTSEREARTSSPSGAWPPIRRRPVRGRPRRSTRSSTRFKRGRLRSCG